MESKQPLHSQAQSANNADNDGNSLSAVHCTSDAGTSAEGASAACCTPRYDCDSEQHQKAHRRSRMRRCAIVIAGVTAAIAVGFSILMLAHPSRFDIKLNGHTQTVSRETTVGELIEDGLASAVPGDLLAVDGSVLEVGGGAAFACTVNGNPVEDGEHVLQAGDVVTLEDGADAPELSHVETVEIDSSIVDEGVGAVHAYTDEGQPGIVKRIIGDQSGIAIDKEGREAQNGVLLHYNVDTHGDKVVALTFDDGPWSGSTSAILDILDANGAKATFFTIGSQMENLSEVVRRAVESGHQICTHTWDHASGSGQGVNLGYMTAEEQIAEIQRGYDAIAAATGAEASHVIRAPGGNYPASVATNLKSLVKAEIGWNIDTRDWTRPGVDAIASKIKSAGPGDIVLMHDGGGDRSQTVEALRKALPYLKEQGYRFVTIDDLLSYGIPGQAGGA